MKKMKKLLSVVLAGVMVMSSVGCGSKGADTGAKADTSAQETAAVEEKAEVAETEAEARGGSEDRYPCDRRPFRSGSGSTL